MHYGILINRKGWPTWYHDAILPGLIPDATFDAMECSVADSLGLCKLCDAQGARAHVIDWASGRKLCPILFADVVRPPWKVEDIT